MKIAVFMYNLCSMRLWEGDYLKHLVSLRGATTVEADTREAIDNATMEMMEALIKTNSLIEEQVVHVYFTTTDDLSARYPSVVLRDVIGWKETAILNVAELKVQEQLPRCIRVMVTIETERSKDSFAHVYLNEAVQLRPDWIRQRP